MTHDSLANLHPSASRHRALARTIAALFVLTMLLGMVDAYFAAPVLRGALADIYGHRNLVLVGALSRLMMSIGVVGIAIAFLPVMRPWSDTIAVSYLAFRTAECVLLALGVCGHLILIGLSEGFDKAAPPAGPSFEAVRNSVLVFTDTTYQMAMTLLGVAGTFQCGLLYRVRLVPQWIAALGLMGYPLLFASGILDILGTVDTTAGLGGLMYVPGGLFEFLILPAWLLWRGFNRPSERA